MKFKKFSITLQIAFFIAFVCLLICGFGVWQALNSRKLHLIETTYTASNLARALAKHAEDACNVADTLLVGLVERLEENGAQPEMLERMRTVLLARNAGTFLSQRIVVIDEHGHWLLSSQPGEIKNLDSSEREYFIYHREHTDAGLHIGHPIHGKLTGSWIITISRRFNHPDGSFAGVVLASINLIYFEKFYDSFDIGKHGTIVLAADDGTIFVRRPFVDKLIGESLKDGIIFTSLLPNAPQGVLENKSPLDGMRRIIGYTHADKFPLIAIAGLSEDDALAEWRTDCYRNFSGIVVLLFIIVLLGYRLIKQIVLRLEGEVKLLMAQAELKVLNQELEKLAQQDGLTGLFNRRQFDVLLQDEFNRAIRYSHSLAVVMIDVDLFKQYNDTYGHLAGDDCLRAIARVLQSHVKRPADVVARYGGEEFILILNDDDVKSAVKVAETIRMAVFDLQMVHSSSPHTVVTISCGISAAIPSRDGNPSPLDLIHAADQALYNAKSNGRNCVMSSEVTWMPSSRKDDIKRIV